MKNLYTIYDNRTDELIALDCTAEECAELLGRTLNNFYCTVSNSKSGKSKRWHIEAEAEEPRKVNYKGKLYTLKQIADISGLNIKTVYSRFKYGWKIDKIVETPLIDRS